MSESGHSNIEWKLNELLLADRRARNYARSALQTARMEPVSFTPWQPAVIPALPAALGSASLPEPDAAPEPDLIAPPDQVAADAALRDELQARIDQLQDELEQVAQQRLQEGLKQGRAEATAEFTSQLNAMQTLVAQLSDIHLDLAPLVAYIEQLALTLARSVLRQPELRNEDYYRALMHEALAALPLTARQDLQLFLHPSDLAALRPLLERANPGLDLQADPALQPGDLRLASGHTEIEERLQLRLEEAFMALTRRDLEDEA